MAWPETLQLFDEAVLENARGAPTWATPVWVAFTILGAGWGLLFLLPFAAMRATRIACAWLFASIAATHVITSIAKPLIGRIRPCDALAWCAPIAIASPGGNSFPSGHASGSFAFAAFVSLRAPRLAPIVLAYAAIVAWSRCALGVHYPTDVIAGSLLGIAVGVSFALFYSSRHSSRYSSRHSSSSSRVASPSAADTHGTSESDPV